METALTVRSQMQQKLAAIDERLKQVKAFGETPFKTNGEFRYNPNGTVLNIFHIRSVSSLLEILSFLLAKKEWYERAAELLKVNEYPSFVWLNYTTDDWKHDIAIRISLLTHKEKIDKLTSAKAQLQSFMTEDDRLAMVLKDIESLGI